MIDREDKYRSSREFLARARKSLVGGVSSPFRAKLPVPLYFEDALGSRARDVDGNEFIDYACGTNGAPSFDDVKAMLGIEEPLHYTATNPGADDPLKF